MDKEIQDQITDIVYSTEYKTSSQNQSNMNEEYEAFIDMFDSERTDKDYDWMSDISIPEFISHMLTQCSIDVNQYFKTRNFVEVFLEDATDEAIDVADAAKELLNRTLNQRYLHHYQKFVRGKLINHLKGSVYFEAWWEQKTKKAITRKEEQVVDRVDEGGNLVKSIETVEIDEYKTIIDRFNYDVVDPRNVFTDNSYCYTLQDKPYVMIRSEKTLMALFEEKDTHGYFNLDKLSEDKTDGATKTSSETYNKIDEFHNINLKNNNKFDVLKRYGKFWVVVKKRNENEIPIEVEPGIDKEGNVKENAELHEMIITHAISGDNATLIGFNLTPYLDTNDEPFRPVFRGLCYVHPAFDSGAGDGKYSRELQIAIDDSFNLGNDRVRLATMPTFKGKKYALDDNDEAYMEPMHIIPLEDTNDLQEIKIDDNITGTLNTIAMLTNGMDKVTSIYPTTMGSTPAAASTTATAVAGAETRTDMRSNYKALTFENTALYELYWMIQQMTYRFASAETLLKLMGDKAYNFDPSRAYYYRPLSASIETDQSKDAKISRLTQIYGMTQGVQHPDTPKVLNNILHKIFTLMGDEEQNITEGLFDNSKPMMGTAAVSPENITLPQSNQYGITQSKTEQATRGTL